MNLNSINTPKRGLEQQVAELAEQVAALKRQLAALATTQGAPVAAGACASCVESIRRTGTAVCGCVLYGPTITCAVGA